MLHCDLAARNILVFKSKNGNGFTFKIADFGLSRILYVNQKRVSVVKKQQESQSSKLEEKEQKDKNTLTGFYSFFLITRICFNQSTSL
jgi:tRNA A-37 threonylcarbamoyl transferase component Bud32